jgi:hypothetical protein
VNRQSSLRFAVSFLFAAFAVAAMALADFGALAQNSNSSATAEDRADAPRARAPRSAFGRGQRQRG